MRCFVDLFHCLAVPAAKFLPSDSLKFVPPSRTTPAFAFPHSDRACWQDLLPAWLAFSSFHSLDITSSAGGDVAYQVSRFPRSIFRRFGATLEKRKKPAPQFCAELTVASLRSMVLCYLRFISTKIIDSSSTRGIKFEICCFCKGALEQKSAVTSRTLRIFVLFTESHRKMAQSPTSFNRSHNFTSSNRLVCKTYCVVGTIDLANKNCLIKHT